MAIDLGGGRRLVLAVDQGGWIWLLVGAAALVALAALSRAERRLVPRRVGRALLLLRGLAASALALALLEPVVSRSWTEPVEGLLVVGVDLSASMDTRDARRPDAERDRLRDAPGLAPPADGDEAPTRLAIASRILRGEAMAALGQQFALDGLGFARSALPAEVAELAALIDRGEPFGDEPDARLATDWGPVLDRALAGGRSAPVVGVVLLTDGLRNAPPGGPRGADPADRLAEAGVPVFPVLIGSTIPPRDAAVTAIRAPESAFLGDSVSVAVEVKADGFGPGAEIPVTLEVPGAEPLRSAVAAGPDGSRPVASFRVTPGRAGPLELVASVEPPGGPDERPENDRRSATIRVGEEPARVLLVDAEARWEFRYLRAMLERDRRVEVVPVLLAPPPPSGASGPTFASELPEAPPAGSEGPDPLHDYDVILLGDVPPDLAPPGLWDRLRAFVSDRGGTLVISAGPRGWPGPWRSDESARALLPVLDPAPVPIDPAAVDPARAALPPGVRVRPADEAGASPDDWPMLQFAADPDESRAAWDGLAPLTFALAGRPKPGATALLVADRPGGGGSSEAVVAAQPFGLGKVLWVGTNGTWRWRLRVGDAYHHRFWGQVVRWAADPEAPGGNRLVRFGPDRPRVPSGSPFPIRARISAEVPGVGPDLLAAARIEALDDDDRAAPDPDRAPVLVPLHPSPGRPGTFEAVVPGLEAGRYRAVLDAPALAEFLASRGLAPTEARFEAAPEPTAELIDLAADPDPLALLASRTGGRLLLDHDAGRLPELLRPLALERTRTAEAPLWDTPVGLITFFCLLAAEWILRKRAGLP